MLDMIKYKVAERRKRLLCSAGCLPVRLPSANQAEGLRLGLLKRLYAAGPKPPSHGAVVCDGARFLRWRAC